MSDFVARMVTRTTGATGLQPRIAPITAPEPWHEPLDLELAAIERTAPDPSPTVPPRLQRTATPSVEVDPFVERARVHASPRTVERESSLRADESRLSARVPPRHGRRPDPDLPMADLSMADLAMADLAMADLASRVTPSGGSASVRAEAPSSFVEITDEREVASEAPSRVAAVPSLRARLPALGRRELSMRPASSDAASIVELEHEMERETEQTDPSSDSNTTASEHARHSIATVGTPSPGAMLDPTGVDPMSDVPRPPRRRESTHQATVRVEIGRVELRAAPSREPVDVGVPKPETFVSLKQYLRERGGK